MSTLIMDRGLRASGAYPRLPYVAPAGAPFARLKSRMQDIEASKSRMRRKRAARSVAEKLQMLDDLRARAMVLKKNDPKRPPPSG